MIYFAFHIILQIILMANMKIGNHKIVILGDKQQSLIWFMIHLRFNVKIVDSDFLHHILTQQHIQSIWIGIFVLKGEKRIMLKKPKVDDGTLKK